MADSAIDPQYQRLTWAHRRGTSFFAFSPARSSLWLGGDHLLCIDSTGYNERYKRFYFRDIQAVVLRKTEHGGIWALAFGSLLGLCTLFAFVSRDTLLPYVLGTLAGLSGLALVLQLAAGPTCVCQVRTAVQVEELPALNRVRRARKVLARLRPIIAAAQGELSPEQVATRFQHERGVTSAPDEKNVSGAATEAVENPAVPPKIEP
jgi:hypothetical protein